VAGEQRRWRARAEWRELDGVIASGSRGAAASRRRGCGDEGVEASGEGEMVPAAGRRETVSPTDRQRDGVTHRAAAARVARGADVVAGQHRRREVAAAAAQLSCVRDASVRVPLKRRLRLTSGPRQFFYLIRFSDTHTLIFEKVIFLIP
jgi:hypothetical protein